MTEVCLSLTHYQNLAASRSAFTQPKHQSRCQKWEMPPQMKNPCLQFPVCWELFISQIWSPQKKRDGRYKSDVDDKGIKYESIHTKERKPQRIKNKKERFSSLRRSKICPCLWKQTTQSTHSLCALRRHQFASRALWFLTDLLLWCLYRNNHVPLASCRSAGGAKEITVGPSEVNGLLAPKHREDSD